MGCHQHEDGRYQRHKVKGDMTRPTTISFFVFSLPTLSVARTIPAACVTHVSHFSLIFFMLHEQHALLVFCFCSFSIYFQTSSCFTPNVLYLFCWGGSDGWPSHCLCSVGSTVTDQSHSVNSSMFSKLLIVGHRLKIVQKCLYAAAVCNSYSFLNNTVIQTCQC